MKKLGITLALLTALSPFAAHAQVAAAFPNRCQVLQPESPSTPAWLWTVDGALGDNVGAICSSIIGNNPGAYPVTVGIQNSMMSPLMITSSIRLTGWCWRGDFNAGKACGL